MQAATAAAPAKAREGSPLLSCLSQLNDDVFTSYLLPKLIEQGSAGAVALTCSQLRRLCQDSIQHLDLTKKPQRGNPCLEPRLAEQLVDAFSHCTSLDLTWHSSSIVDVYKNISTLLAGLPALNTISIKLQSGGEDGSLDPVLAVLHLHATALRSLCLQLDSSWEKHHKTWGTLGKMVNLTQLQLLFGWKVENPVQHLNLVALMGLTRLQSLTVDAPGAVYDDSTAQQLAAQQLPGCLTSLTELLITIDVLYHINSISKCTKLCNLQLRLADGDDESISNVTLGRRECRALAQLACLTRLYVDLDADDLDATEQGGFYGVLRQLKSLRRVGVHCWAAESLSVLQSLTHLTALEGHWVDPSTAEMWPEPLTEGLWGAFSPVDLGGLVCPHIKELGDTLCAPFQAFPNLVCVTLDRQHVMSLHDLVASCTALQKLALTASATAYATRSKDPWGILEFRLLAQLQHLTHLELAPGNDACLVSFATAAAAVRTPKLRCLHVRGPVTCYALMQLQSVCGLQELTICMSAKKVSTKSFSAESVRMLLVSLAAVPKVCLVLCSQEQLGVVASARRWAARMELPLPAVLKVSVANTPPDSIPEFEDEV